MSSGILRMWTILAGVTLAIFLSNASFGQTDEQPSDDGEATTELSIEVTGCGNANDDASAANPVKGAKVFVRWMEENEEKEKRLVTGSTGTVNLADVPQAMVTIQVVKTECETFGKDYELDQDVETVSISLLRKMPPGQDVESDEEGLEPE